MEQQVFQSDDFKKIILKLMIDSSEDYEIYSPYITIDMFPKFLKPIYLAIRSLRRKGMDGVIPKGVLEEELANTVDSQYFESFLTVVETIYNQNIEDVESIRSIIEEGLKRERLISAIIKASEYIKDKKVDKFDEIPILIEDALNINTVVNYISYSDLYTTKDEAKDDIKERISTGIPTLDDCLMGGYGKKEVHIILGGAKSGKTTFAIRTAVDMLKQNKKIVHVTLELKESLVKLKYVSSITGLSYSEVINDDYSAVVQKRIKMFEDKYNPKLIIKKLPAGKTKVSDIKAFIKSLIYKGELDGVDVVIIDYDALLSPSRKIKDKYEAEGEKYIEMAELADYFDCVVLVPSQTNREGWRKSERGEIITSTDIAESGAKKMHCDSIITLNRLSEDKMILYVDTVRFGESGVEIDLSVDMTRNRMAELKNGEPVYIFSNIEDFDSISPKQTKKEINGTVELNKVFEEVVENLPDDNETEFKGLF